MSDELMFFLQKKPYFFEIIKDKELMAVLKDLQKGGKSATDLAKNHKMEYDYVKQALEELTNAKAIQKFQQGNHWIYILDFESQRLLELQEKAKSSI